MEQNCDVLQITEYGFQLFEGLLHKINATQHRDLLVKIPLKQLKSHLPCIHSLTRSQHMCGLQVSW